MRTRAAQSKPALREFTVWRANGEASIEQGETVPAIAKKYRQPAEPGAEVVAIIALEFLVKPSAQPLPMQFVALGGRKAS